MPTKPQPKSEMALDWYSQNQMVIYFYASKDALEDIKDFGLIIPGGKGNEHYWLTVDSRYDFNQVLQYIKDYS